MNTYAIADLAVLLCMIPAVLIIYAVFLIPPYREETDEKKDGE